ncbi:Glycosyltransferase involved in cell wall bisynthesis [Psychroflexus sediminis]|uniref:Glycosyltransferase involved in cell wall bisynthesis n=2 Tax=Psychroflexus sediminis TaxID=470826 RepID=A0A1G7Z3S9_9FLAO|nr:Glycosyltransferase involved in cell wall bisynthesis [Psychroflexus sediminis]
MTSNEKQSTKIRVIQLIDSLDAGGAERMAVNLSNALVDQVEFSGLVVSRSEGVLKTLVDDKVSYFFCSKKRSLDIAAIFFTLRFIKKNKINLLHAHGSSYFFAFLLKTFYPQLKLVWHDHHGNRPNESQSLKTKILKKVSNRFSHIFCVSKDLVKWSRKALNSSNVSLIHNFTMSNKISFKNETEFDFPYIVCVANLRWQKNHLNLIKAYSILKQNNMKYKLILVGADKNDGYSHKLREKIKDLNLEKDVHILGQRSDVESIIANSSLCVLTSDVEALPMVLIEYANHKKPVIVTDVGQCADVVGNYAQVVKPNDAEALSKAIGYYIDNPDVAKRDAEALHEKVQKEFNAEVIIRQIIDIYEEVLK